MWKPKAKLLYNLYRESYECICCNKKIKTRSTYYRCRGDIYCSKRCVNVVYNADFGAKTYRDRLLADGYTKKEADEIYYRIKHRWGSGLKMATSSGNRVGGSKYFNS